MKIWIVYQWDRWDHTEYDRRYFLNQEKAMQYYENSKEGDLHGIWDTDEFVHARWDWVLNEIIFALEQYTDDDAESKFYDHSDVNEEDDLMTQVRSIKIDREGLEAHQKRVQNGFRLLGLHWTGLWS